MPVSWLRRGTTYPSGIAAGGADTGFDVTPQETLLCVRMATTAKTIYVPLGTTLIAKVMFPDPTSPSTTGDYQIDRVTGGANAELAASAAETPIVTLYSPAKRLAVTTEYTIIPTNSPDGYTYVGFKVILPRTRS